MKFSAAVLSALCATVLAAPAPAPAPAPNAAKPRGLANRARLNRRNHLARQAETATYDFGSSSGESQGSSDSGSGGWGGSATSDGSDAQPSGSSSFGGSYGGSSSGSYGASSPQASGVQGGSGSSGTYGSSGAQASGVQGGSGLSGTYGSSGAQASGVQGGSGSSGTYGSSGAQPSASGTASYKSNSSGSSSTDSAAASSSSTSSSSDDALNESWAGVVVQGDEGSVTGVSASFTLPSISLPTDGAQQSATTHTASTWIGIDGYSCGTGLWQAGVDGSIDSSGSVTWYAWYEWYPADTVTVELGDLAEGDTIFVNVTASSTTEGTVIMENKSAGKTFTKTVTSSSELCLADAEWIEEDLVIDSDDIGLADFGTVTFEDAVATTKTGTLSLTGDASYMDIEDSEGNQLTSSSSTSNTVVIKYD